MGRRRQLRILCDNAIDAGIGQAFELLRVEWPFTAFACRSVLRVIIKTSHSTGPASPN
jgi:hypothetical protein